jgi:hypothetical protein
MFSAGDKCPLGNVRRPEGPYLLYADNGETKMMSGGGRIKTIIGPSIPDDKVIVVKDSYIFAVINKGFNKPGHYNLITEMLAAQPDDTLWWVFGYYTISDLSRKLNSQEIAKGKLRNKK